MGARGPKSAAELTTIVGFKAKAPEPDASLTEAQKAIWRRCVQSKPGDFFHDDDLMLLAELCRAVDMAKRLAGRIDAIDFGNSEALARALALRDKEVRRITVLATKLRMTPQSRYDKGAAATASKRANRGSKPWEFDPSDRFFED